MSVPAAGRARNPRRRPLPRPGALPRLICLMTLPKRRRLPLLPGLLFALSFLLSAAVSHAASLRVVASDPQGVTLELALGVWTTGTPAADGRVRILGMEGAYELSETGRPRLPAWRATLAVPPGARPTAHVVASEGELTRQNVRVAIAGRNVMRPSSDPRFGEVPAIEPAAAIHDGVWPDSPVRLSAPFPFRGRRLAGLEVRPFRADDEQGSVTAPLKLRVRVDWNLAAGAAARVPVAGAADRHVDASLASAVINWDQGAAWREPPAPLTDARRTLFDRARGAAPGAALAFDETQPEVRVKLDETALWRLPFDELSAKGYPDNVAVSEVSVHRHEFLEGALPPYGTIELPSEVEDGNANGVFDSGDAVWVYARTWAERSGATQSRRYWGDAEVVYVTRKPGGALRLPQRAGWNNVAGLTPLTSFPSKRHYEKDLSPILSSVETPADTNLALYQWTSFALYYNRPDTLRVDATGIDTTQSVDVSVRWVGRNRDNHFISAAFRNGTSLVTPFADSVYWFGKTALTVNRTLPGRTFSDGSNNFLRQWGKSGFGPPDPSTNFIAIAGLDWYEITYGRFFRAAKDYLRFNSASASGDLQIQVSGFSGDSIRVWDVTDPDAPVSVLVDRAHITSGPGGLAVEFQDVAAPGVRREYVAATWQGNPDPAFGPRTPASGSFSTVTRRDVWNHLSGDYLVVVPEAFESALAPLETHRATQGLSVVHAPVEAVYDEFDGGRHSATAIRRFAKYAYQRWNARFLLLAGDGTLDPNRAVANSGVDWVPVLPTLGPVGTSDGFEIVPSDNLYAFISGNNDPIENPDTSPVLPELMVGRLTVNSLAEANTQVQKILAYENVQPGEDWRKNLLLLSDDAFSGETTFGGNNTTSGYCHRDYEEEFVRINNRVRTAVESDTGVTGMQVQSFNLIDYLPDEDIVIDPLTNEPCRVDRSVTASHTHNRVTPLLLGLINSGVLWWNYQGHANEYVLTHEDLYVNSTGSSDDALRLVNAGKPFIFTAFSCHANMFARPGVQTSSLGPSIGEDMMALPNGRGAVASWASVCFEVVPRADDHVNNSLARMMFVHTPHDEFLGADDRGARFVLGEVVLATLADYLPIRANYAPERGLAVTYTLLGDPATRVSIGQPINTILANGSPVPASGPLRLHTPGNGLQLDATFVSTARLDSLGLYKNTGAGDVPVPATDYALTPAFPDTAAATAVFGGRRFRLVYDTQLEARSTDYTFVVRDRDGLVRRTLVSLPLDAVLRVSNNPISDRDEVAPGAALSLLVLSPRPIADPVSEITLSLNGENVAFTAAPAPGDASNREWILTWSHDNYPIDDYTLVMSVTNGGTVLRTFRVTAASSQLGLRDLIPFPNPFDNDGTRFSFLLLGGEPADIRIHVFTQAGRSIYSGTTRDLAPGYHQLAWDGRDAEGDEIANGVYFYRVVARSASGASTQQFGRLVKLRKPRRVEEPVIP